MNDNRNFLNHLNQPLLYLQKKIKHQTKSVLQGYCLKNLDKVFNIHLTLSLLLYPVTAQHMLLLVQTK